MSWIKHFVATRKCAAHAGLAIVLATSMVVAAPDAEARVTRIVIDNVESPTAGGVTFGDIGQYERISGRAFGELDPYDPRNAIIQDIELAPRTASGMAEYVASFSLVKPINMAKASGVLWYDWVNRGSGSAQPNVYGHVGMVSGWQGDLTQTATNQTVQVPVAVNPDGSPITGVVLARIADMPPGTNTQTLQVLGRAIPYDAVLDKTRARLIKKVSETRTGVNGPTFEVPSSDWDFADCRTVPFPGVPDPRRLCLKDGFDPQFLYEMVYQAQGPTVLGLGLAAARDVVSFFRYEHTDSVGTANPIAGAITHAITQGVSQSGNALKTFIHLGFNEDEWSWIVFDGANPHIAGRLTPVNIRFGVPSGSGTLYEPGGEGVLWWHKFPDHVRNRKTAGLLDRCQASGTCPKIFETFGSTEFNARLMSIALTGTSGKVDIPLPRNVRRYYFPGTTHGGGSGGFNHAPALAAGCALASNPNPESDTMNALQVALVEWVVNGIKPPASVYPLLRKKTLVRANKEAMGFPTIPGVPSPTGQAIGLMDYDFGPELNYNDFSGVITEQPPDIRQIIPPFMPKVGADGNELIGVASVLHQAPLGTYTGWNPTATGWFVGQPCGGGLIGGYIPFATTKAERRASGDPRLSLEERYGTQEGYVCVVRTAATKAVSRRFLLQADADRLIGQAEVSNILPSTSSDPTANAVADRLCKPKDKDDDKEEDAD
jgi:Alpha/beta hydrolase domain